MKPYVLPLLSLLFYKILLTFVNKINLTAKTKFI